MSNILIEKHNHNISNLENIIRSIQNYLHEIHTKPRFRDERNRSKSMKEWQDLFIESKLNLNIAFNKIFTAGAKAQSLHQINHQSFNQLKKVMTEFPELNFNTTENHQLNHFNSVSSTSKQSNIEIYDAWKNTKKEDLDIVKTFFEETSTGFENYNLWISKTESYLTLKLYDLNYLESIIKNIFQENSMAKHLYSHIIKNKFYQINLPSNFSSNNIILE